MSQGVYNGSAPYIFISYSHKDSARVAPYISGLQARGFRVWCDGGIEAGTEWPAYIEQRLENCECLLVFLSDNTVESVNCRNEINVATELKKEVLVAQLDETVAFKYGMRLQLSSRQKLFCFRHENAETMLDEMEKAKMLENCREETVPTAPVAPPVPPTPPAPPVAPPEREIPVPPASRSKKSVGWHWTNFLCIGGWLLVVLACAFFADPELLLPMSSMALCAAFVAVFRMPQILWRVFNTLLAVVSTALMALGIMTHPTMSLTGAGDYIEALGIAAVFLGGYIVVFIITSIKRRKQK